MTKLDTTASNEPRSGKHSGRKIQRCAFDLGPGLFNQRQQAAVAGAQVEHAVEAGRQQLDQHGLAFGAVRQRIRPREIGEGVAGFGEFIHFRFAHKGPFYTP